MDEKAKEKVEELVERFDRNIESYKRPSYKEASLRLQFINPLFEALGWDVHNKQGWAEEYKPIHI